MWYEDDYKYGEDENTVAARRIREFADDNALVLTNAHFDLLYFVAKQIEDHKMDFAELKELQRG